MILACDTTQSACSAALWQDGLIASELEEMTAGHAEALMPMLQRLMRDHGATPRDLTRLAVTNGPGTFTGTRVGLAAMRGLALGLSLPVKAYGTLAVMARAASGKRPLIVAVDARRETFYVQAFAADGTPAGDPQALDAAATAALTSAEEVGLLGSGAEKIAALAPSRFVVEPVPAYPQAQVLASMAAADAAWPAAGAALPEPFYLRPPDAALPNPDKIPARK